MRILVIKLNPQYPIEIDEVSERRNQIQWLVVACRTSYLHSTTKSLNESYLAFDVKPRLAYPSHVTTLGMLLYTLVPVIDCYSIPHLSAAPRLALSTGLLPVDYLASHA
jgi:hypothetical protein